MENSILEKSNCTIVNRTSRGIPGDVLAFPLQNAGDFNWSVPNEDLCLPILTLSRPAFANNLWKMEQYAKEQDVYLCPHGKTMMSPQLFAELLKGERTIGLSAATIPQARVEAESGAPIVLLANQVVGKANIRAFALLIKQFPWTQFLMLIESPDALVQLLRHGAGLLPEGETFNIIVELGYPEARTGLQTPHALEELVVRFEACLAQGAPISIRGVQAYEGAIAGSHTERVDKIADYLAFAAESYNVLAKRNIYPAGKPPIFTAGGSSSFDLVLKACRVANFEVQPQIWLRGGVAPTYDHIAYRERLAEMDARRGFELGGQIVSAVKEFRPALALWAVVQSLPKKGQAILAAGIRDFPYDAGLPIALEQYRDGKVIDNYSFATTDVKIAKANDQHAFLEWSGDLDVKIGDVFKLGISHPCTAFDKWRFVFCVDENDVVTDMVETFF